MKVRCEVFWKSEFGILQGIGKVGSSKSRTRELNLNHWLRGDMWQ
jgi:hypothetical protein